MPRRIQPEIPAQVQEVVSRHRKLFHVGNRSRSACHDLSTFNGPEAGNSLWLLAVLQRIQQSCQRNFSLADDRVVNNPRLQTLFGIGGWVRTAENDFDSGMIGFEPSSFLNGIRQFARHASDTNDLDLVMTNVPVDSIRTLLDNHVQDRKSTRLNSSHANIS